MSNPPSTLLFVNLFVRDVARARAFFTALGFGFNEQFSNVESLCMILGGSSFVMLLAESRMVEFSKKKLCDTSTHSEGLFSFSVASRAAVDEIVNKAMAAGATHAMPPADHGFMYGWSFYDLDGHHWEVFWMDPAAVQG